MDEASGGKRNLPALALGAVRLRRQARRRRRPPPHADDRLRAALLLRQHVRVLAGAGVGLVLSPANTDALNRVPRSRYGEATGITQTVRNFGSSLGLALLGTVLILENKSNLESTLGEEGIPKSQADQIAESLTEAGGGNEAAFAETAGFQAKEIFSGSSTTSRSPRARSST